MVWVCPPHTSMSLYCAARLAQRGDLRRQRVGLVGVAELVNESHRRRSYSIRESCRAASSSS